MSEAGYVQYRRTSGRKKRRLYTLSAVIAVAAIAVFMIDQHRQVTFLQSQLSALKQAHQQLHRQLAIERLSQTASASAQRVGRGVADLIEPDQYFDRIHPPNAPLATKLAVSD